MTIESAITKAKSSYNWSIVPHEPTGVCVRYKTKKGKILCARGLLDEEGKMKGSVMVIDFDSRECLDEYLKSEPYIMEKVWEKVAVEPMNVVVLNGEKVGS